LNWGQLVFPKPEEKCLLPHWYIGEDLERVEIGQNKERWQEICQDIQNNYYLKLLGE
jgi:hypothetical protein